MIESPCIKKCKLSDKNSICMGCGRTLEEISIWRNLTDTEKEKIALRAKRKLEELDKCEKQE